MQACTRTFSEAAGGAASLDRMGTFVTRNSVRRRKIAGLLTMQDHAPLSDTQDLDRTLDTSGQPRTAVQLLHSLKLVEGEPLERSVRLGAEPVVLGRD